jgi:hypothetical protein
MRTWRKSSYSNGGNNNCVEVAAPVAGERRHGVRDSTRAHGPVLNFGTAAWRSFLGAVGGAPSNN